MNAATGDGGFMRRILSLAAAGGLAACGGSGGSGNEGTGGDGSAIVSHSAQVRALDAAAARLGDLDFTATLPASGTASYAGHLGATAVFSGAPVFVTAEVAMTARFGAGTISGTYSEAGAADGSVTGSGRFDNGAIGATGITAEVTGTLLRSGAAQTVDADLRGAFLGSGAEGLVGTIEGRLLTGGAETGRFDGEVWAERQ
jgi:hypothetical protein